MLTGLLSLDPGILVVSLIIFAALVLFYTEAVPIDVTAIGIVVMLALTGVWTGVTPGDAVSGFSSKATLTILAFFILSEGVRETGVVQLISRKIVAFTKSDEKRQLLAVTGIAGTFSGFINNVAVVGVMIPVVNDLVEKTEISPSKLLMPMSFVAISAGQLTLIASTDNLVIAEFSERLLNRSIGMFELTALGAVMMVTAMLYFLVVGYRLVPSRGGNGGTPFDFELKDYLTELTVPDESSFVGKRVSDVNEAIEANMDVLEVVDKDGRRLRQQFRTLQPGDVIRVVTDRDTLMDIIDREDLDLVPETEAGHKLLEEEKNAYTLIQAMIPRNSSLVGARLGSVPFRLRYDTSVLAVKREGQVIRQELQDVGLRPGDVLLLQTFEDNLDELVTNRDFVLMKGSERMAYKSEKAPLAVGIVALVIAATALDFVPVEIAGLAGVVGMAATGCVTPQKMYEAVDWRVIFLISGVIPLGVAMEEAGLAALLAHELTALGAALSPTAMLVVVYLAAQLSTSLMNDNAAMVLMAPIAIDVAHGVGADPFSYLLAVLFAGGTAVLTPMGFQTNLMIWTAGDFTFRDFLKVGIPLNIVLSIVVLVGILTFWGV